jgi:hypothetical protein
LSKGELTLGVQAWAKQSQFTDAPKVSGGFGEYILRKMGWKEGEGLGKDGSGEVDPLTLDIKQDMKGKYSPCYTKRAIPIKGFLWTRTINCILSLMFFAFRFDGARRSYEKAWKR